MMGDDGAGAAGGDVRGEPGRPVGGHRRAPENDIVAIRGLRPERLLIVDATDMG